MASQRQDLRLGGNLVYRETFGVDIIIHSRMVGRPNSSLLRVVPKSHILPIHQESCHRGNSFESHLFFHIGRFAHAYQFKPHNFERDSLLRSVHTVEWVLTTNDIHIHCRHAVKLRAPLLILAGEFGDNPPKSVGASAINSRILRRHGANVRGGTLNTRGVRSRRDIIRFWSIYE